MTEIEQLEKAIAVLEAQRTTLGDAVANTALTLMREQLAALKTHVQDPEQRKLATILFTDVVGSTRLGYGLDPEEIIEIMDDALKRLAVPVQVHGGHVTRFMGDGFKAIFGLPVAHENDAEQAIRAGLGILETARNLADELETGRRLPGFNVRVGVNTGLVAAGGFTEGRDTIMGLTINLGARMERAAPPGGLLISHHTYRHVRGVFDVEPLEPVIVKGFDEPVPVYLVQRAKPRAFRKGTRGVEGIETRMVGRGAELLVLQSMLNDAIQAPGVRAVTITGEAGIGKSRLLYEFENWIELLPDQVTYFKGRATPEMQAAPYSLLRDMFAFRFEILESDNAATAISKFRAGMKDILDPERADLVGHLVGFDFSASQAVRNLSGSRSFGQLATAYLTDYLRTVSDRPTVLFFEDVHWADESSLDLIDHLVPEMAAARLLLVCLARPPFFERRPNWGGGWLDHTQLDLEPLSKGNSRMLVAEILQKVDDVPDALQKLIVDGAEGNPFYVEELIKMLIEDGVIVREGQRWHVELERLAKVRVPSTLTGVLQARLDSLPCEEKILLQQASVVGRLFWDAAVAALEASELKHIDIEARKHEIAPLLDAVRGRELVFQRKYSVFEGTDEYIFKHNILRDVAYETVLLRLRRVYHKQVARWLESTAGERLSEYLSLIAGHYELAGETLKAADYLRQSGEELLRVSAFREASSLLEQALVLVPAESRARTPLVILAGLALSRLSDFDRARRRLEEGLTLARQYNDDRRVAEALDYLGEVAALQGKHIEAKACLEESLALGWQVDDQHRIAHVLKDLGFEKYRLGAFVEGRAHAAESLSISEVLGDQRGRASALNALGAMAFSLSEYDEAANRFIESLDICRELGDRWGMSGTLINLGVTAQAQGDLTKAQSYHREAITLSKEIEEPLGVAMCLNSLGQIASSLGNYTEAASNFSEALEVAMRIGAISQALEIMAGLAELWTKTGQLERALELLGLIQHHPAVESAAKTNVETLIADLEDQVPPDVIEAALKRGQALVLEDVAAELLAEGQDQQTCENGQRQH